MQCDSNKGVANKQLIHFDFDYGGITAFHCGVFATFYFCAAFAIWVYYRHIRGDIALSLQSAASGLCHILIYISGMITPPSQHLYLAIACYCCCASPTIMLCLREAIDPGWISWKRYFQYIGPFLAGTVLAAIFASEYIFFVMIFADFWFCCYAAVRLIKGINRHEKMLKYYYAEIEDYSYNWVRGFVYFQIATVVAFFLLYCFLSVPFNIIFNYVQAFYWLYFILMCKRYRYYSCQIPKDEQEEIKQLEQLEAEEEEEETAAVMEEVKVEEEEVIMAEEEIKAEEEAVEEVVEAEEKAEAAEEVTDEVISEEKKTDPANQYRIREETEQLITAQLERFEKTKGYSDPYINLAALSLIVGTNSTYLYHYFKRRNLTFSYYIHQLRFKAAIQLMTIQPDLTMAIIAERVGFRNEGSFRKHFFNYFGMSPFNYRRKLLIDKSMNDSD